MYTCLVQFEKFKRQRTDQGKKKIRLRISKFEMVLLNLPLKTFHIHDKLETGVRDNMGLSLDISY